MKKFLLSCLAIFVLSGCGDDSQKKTGSAGENPTASESQMAKNSAQDKNGERIGGESGEEVAFTPFKTGERFTLKSVVGGEVTIERTEKGFKLADSDKILMFDIFGTYCQPCRIEAPHLMDFQLKKFADFLMVGLIYFEDITDAQVIENFTKKFNAYYFISNSKQNERIVGQILSDIGYRHALSIPFKVVLKDGKYQRLTDINEGDERGKPYYLGMVDTDVIKSDIARIKMATKTGVQIRTRAKTKSFVPRPYKVILLNDDVTTMDFVVYILMEIFAKNFNDAVDLMMKVHKQGRAVCGAYPKEIAECKQQAVLQAAKTAGFPLRCEIEED